MGRYHSTIKMKPSVCMENPETWNDARMNMLKKGYANRKTKSRGGGSPFDYEVGEHVFLNTNLSDETKLPKTLLPIWGAVAIVRRKRSAYSYLVRIIFAKYNKHSKKKISADKTVVMHIR